MNFLDTLVILDTCVLLKQRVSDVLMDLRSEKVFSAYWTENIDEEFLRNMQEVYELSETSPAIRAAKNAGTTPWTHCEKS